MNAFIAGLVAELNAGITNADDIVEYSYTNTDHKVVVYRAATDSFYTYVKDIRGIFIFIPV